ncbi:MAG: response regulator [Chloroflexi bacterium]|nr:response regulator [Chloroflexota bacterium]
MSNVRFLVVEDDPDGQDLVARLLRHQRMEFDVAASGEDALHYLNSGADYAVAIIDLALPGIDGWGVLEHIRSNPQTADMPCVAVTAYHSTGAGRDRHRAGLHGVLPQASRSDVVHPPASLDAAQLSVAEPLQTRAPLPNLLAGALLFWPQRGHRP